MSKQTSQKRYTRKELSLLEPVEVYKLLLNKSIKCFPMRFFHDDIDNFNSKQCLKYLIEEHLKLSDEDILQKINYNLFTTYKLSGMLAIKYDDSPFKAINDIYPNKFREWQFGNVPRNFWNDENSKEAIQWLLHTKLKVNTTEDINKINKKTFKDHGLNSLISYKFNGSYKQALDFIKEDNKFFVT